MNGLYTVSRFFAGFFGFIALGGVLWFSASLSNAIIIAGVFTGVTSLAVAFVPQRKLVSGTVRLIVILLCLVGIVTGFVLVTNDLKATSGIEWDVVAMNLLHIAALAMIAIIALKRAPGSAQ